MTMDEVYVVQHAAVIEIRIREISLSYQAQNVTRKEQKCKALLWQKEQEFKEQEQKRLILDEAINSTVAKFLEEEGQ